MRRAFPFLEQERIHVCVCVEAASDHGLSTVHPCSHVHVYVHAPIPGHVHVHSCLSLKVNHAWEAPAILSKRGKIIYQLKPGRQNTGPAQSLIFSCATRHKSVGYRRAYCKLLLFKVPSCTSPLRWHPFNVFEYSLSQTKLFFAKGVALPQADNSVPHCQCSDFIIRPD